MPEAAVDAFITRWASSGASERGNAASFIAELCRDVLGVEPPQPARAEVRENTYVFERAVQQPSGTTGFLDCYKQDCFVLKAKQGADAPERTESEALTGQTLRRKMGTARRGTRGWAQAMQSAKRQALDSARARRASRRASRRAVRALRKPCATSSPDRRRDWWLPPARAGPARGPSARTQRADPARGPSARPAAPAAPLVLSG